MLQMDIKDLKKFEELLRLFSGKDWPVVNGASLNKAAFIAMRQGQENIRRQFITRNKFAERSVKYQKVKGFNVLTQESIVGSTMRGMELQEIGGIKKTRGGGPIAIPEESARVSKSMFKLVRRAKYISQLKLVSGKHKRKLKSKSARLVAGMIVAKQRKIALKLRDNIYEVSSMRLSGRGSSRRVKAKLRRLYHVGKRQIDLPKRPWLEPAMKSTMQLMPAIYVDAAQKKVKERFRF